MQVLRSYPEQEPGEKKEDYQKIRGIMNTIIQTRMNSRSKRSLITLIWVFIIIGGAIYPVTAYDADVYHDGGILTGDTNTTHPSYSPDTLKQMNETRVFFLDIKQNWSNLTPEEQKIPPDLLYLILLQKTSKNLSDEYIVRHQMSDIFKPATYQKGTTIEKTPDMVLLEIMVYSGNSTHILDPYVYSEHSRDEEGRGLHAWVEVSKIQEIANLSEVGIIRKVSFGLFN